MKQNTLIVMMHTTQKRKEREIKRKTMQEVDCGKDKTRARMQLRESKKERMTNVNSMSERVWYIGEKVCRG